MELENKLIEASIAEEKWSGELFEQNTSKLRRFLYSISPFNWIKRLLLRSIMVDIRETDKGRIVYFKKNYEIKGVFKVDWRTGDYEQYKY